MSLSARLAAALLVLLALAASHWRVYLAGQQRQADRHAQQQLSAERAQAAQLVRRIDNQTDAQHDRTLAESRIGRDRVAARTELERLRRDLAGARAAATAQSPCGRDPDPRDELLAAMARDIERLGEQGEAIATAADGHAADALMCFLGASTRDTDPTLRRNNDE